MMRRKLISASHVRNFVFGVEDSLVSTVGLLSGVAYAGVEKPTILLIGIILIFVEAFSMAVGSFLSDQSANEFASQKDLPISRSYSSGIVMFISYFISGFIPLVPYVLFPPESAFNISIVASLITLFALGALGSSISKVSPLKGGAQMALIGGVAIVLGVLVGKIFTL